MKKKIYIISGGTMVHIRPHFAVCAPAYGTVGTDLCNALRDVQDRVPGLSEYMLVPIFTKMAKDEPLGFGEAFRTQILAEAGLKHIETNGELAQFVDHILTRKDTRCIVMAAAICDWTPSHLYQDAVKRYRSILDPDGGPYTGAEYVSLDGEFLRDEFGKDKPRLSTRLKGAPEHRKGVTLGFQAADKIIGHIRKERKDVFLVSFKTTSGVTQEETYAAGLQSLKSSSSNLVLANDVQNHHNVVVTPEEFPYYSSRQGAIKELAEMTFHRLQNTFVRTKVVPGDTANLQQLHENGAIPSNFLPVLKHLIDRGAYKTLPWNDSTSGHFGCQVEGQEFIRISSVRKANHNRVLEEGVVKILSDDNGDIVAIGGKPSVGEHTQRTIYSEIAGKDWDPSLCGEAHSIVHFHCEMRPLKNTGLYQMLGESIFWPPTRPQQPYECGSLQCAQNTASGMGMANAGIWFVHLEGHGPNIAWHRDIDPKYVIEYIEKYWDLDLKSGGNLP